MLAPHTFPELLAAIDSDDSETRLALEGWKKFGAFNFFIKNLFEFLMAKLFSQLCYPGDEKLVCHPHCFTESPRSCSASQYWQERSKEKNFYESYLDEPERRGEKYASKGGGELSSKQRKFVLKQKKKLSKASDRDKQ
jgi:hypothetical protein